MAIVTTSKFFSVLSLYNPDYFEKHIIQQKHLIKKTYIILINFPCCNDDIKEKSEAENILASSIQN